MHIISSFTFLLIHNLYLPKKKCFFTILLSIVSVRVLQRNKPRGDLSIICLSIYYLSIYYLSSIIMIYQSQELAHFTSYAASYFPTSSQSAFSFKLTPWMGSFTHHFTIFSWDAQIHFVTHVIQLHLQCSKHFKVCNKIFELRIFNKNLSLGKRNSISDRLKPRQNILTSGYYP